MGIDLHWNYPNGSGQKLYAAGPSGLEPEASPDIQSQKKKNRAEM